MPVPMNLFSLCEQNSPSLMSQFEACLARVSEHERGFLHAFSARVEKEGRTAINLRPTTLWDFLASGRLLNIYEWADLVMQRSSIPREDILQQKLGDYYQKRLSFDDRFEAGQQLR